MTHPACLPIAERISQLLKGELGAGIDLRRMLNDELYARDVLLVCDAHRGTELAAMARRYRRAVAHDAGAPGAPTAPGGASTGFGASRPVLPSDFDAPSAALRPQARVRAWFSPSRWLGR